MGVVMTKNTRPVVPVLVKLSVSPVTGLVMVMVGGWWLVQEQAPVWAMFALISAAMVVYGVSTALFVRLTPWGRT